MARRRQSKAANESRTPMHPKETDDAIGHLEALWEREREAARARHRAVREETTLAERAARGLAIRKAELIDTDAAPGGRTLLWLNGPFSLEDLRLRMGAPVELSAPSAAEPLYGVLVRKGARGIAIAVETEAYAEHLAEAFADGDRAVVEALAPEAPFDAGVRALRTLREEAHAPLRRLLFPDGTENGLARPSTYVDRPLAFFDSDLNDAQRLAVQRAVAPSGEDGPSLHLVHGPPGTGKTRVLVEVIRQGVAAGERVLVCAASNGAVDHLGGRLLAAGADVLRLGHPARVAPVLEAQTLDARAEATPEWKLARRWSQEAAALFHTLAKRKERDRISRDDKRALYSQAKDLRRDARRQMRQARQRIVRQADIVLCTASMAESKVLAEASFDRVVIDEATQAADPIALVPMLRAPNLVMAGDHCQLPPTILDPQAAREGLGRTFFERLAEQAEQEEKGEASDDAGRRPQLTMLTVQHRMHRDIMRFPNEQMYGGALRAHPSVAEARIAPAEGGASPPPVTFLDTAGKGWDEAVRSDGSLESLATRSIENVVQGERVAVEARRLLQAGIAANDIAIITPYDAQVQRLRSTLAEERGQGLTIGSVDGFQGQERDVVIVDLVRSNGDGQVGFLADVRRMNVAMTRARRLLLVIGDSATLGAHPFYADFFEAMGQYGTYRSVWDDPPED